MEGPTGGSFASALRRLRQDRSLTQEELAERAGITVKAVGALERGERTRPYPHTVRALAAALDLDERERADLVASVPSQAARAADRVGRAASGAAVVSRIAAPASALVGRTEDVERICALVLSGIHRLVTVTGPGGVGKTRVALEVLAREEPGISGGAAFVDLAPVRDPSLVLHALASALGVAERGTAATVAALAPALVGRPLLVVLDNFEHLLAAAPVVGDLVAHCPQLVVLVTSRAALRVRAEREVVLAPLAVPATDTLEGLHDSPAAQLFLERAAAAGVALPLDFEVVPAVAAICRRLDGLPLAVELAAAGTRLLTPAALLARMDDWELEPGMRDLSDRQRTMTATLDWSIGLLGPDEVELFTRLGVFAGGFSLEAVEAVVGDHGATVLSPLLTLVEHSLVARTESPDDQPRFRLLEPTRRYAGRMLAASDGDEVTADRHAHYFHDWALVAGPRLRGADLTLELDRLAADHANLRGAYLRLLELGRIADAAEMGGHLWLYFGLRGYAREGLSWLDRLDSGASDAASCQALTGRMGLLFVTGEISSMQQVAQRAVPLARRIDDAPLAAEALTLAGHAAVFGGLLQSAQDLLRDALSMARGSGSPWVEAHALVALGQLTLSTGTYDEDDRVLDAAVEVARALGNPFTLATALTRRATLTALRGEDSMTADLLGESIAIAVEARLSWNLSYALPALAGVAVRLDRGRTAATLFGASASLSADHAVDPRFPVSRDLADRDLGRARAELGDLAFRDAWDAGRIASLAQIAELAHELTHLARE